MTAIAKARDSLRVHLLSIGYAAGAVLLGIFLALHGAAHSLAFFVQWRVTQSQGIPYTTTLLGRRVDVGDIGIRIDGLLWLAAAAAFVIVGLRLAWLRRSAPRVIAAITLFSLCLCVLGLPTAIIGVVIDGAILLTLALAVAAQRVA